MTPARGTRWRPPAPQHTPDSDSQAEILDLDAEVFAEHIASITVWLPIERGPRHIVDLGCGTGAGAFALLARFPESEVTAVDASAGHLHRLREWAEALGVADRVRTVLADLDADWPELGQPELVWASASMHHMADPDRTLRKVHDLLAPGGLFAVVELAGFPRFLPDDAPKERPGLEERCHAALAHHHAEHVPHRGADWGPKLAAARFTVEGERTITVNVDGSRSKAVGHYALSSLKRLRGSAAGTLTAEDLGSLDRLLDTDSPLSILRRSGRYIDTPPVADQIATGPRHRGQRPAAARRPSSRQPMLQCVEFEPAVDEDTGQMHYAGLNPPRSPSSSELSGGAASEHPLPDHGPPRSCTCGSVDGIACSHVFASLLSCTGRQLQHHRQTRADVTPDTLIDVTEKRSPARWLVLVIRIPAEPSRHRVAVWRELRKAGALSLGQGVWAVPALPAFTAGVERAVDLVARADGEATILEAAGRSAADAARFEALFNAARQADWVEFLSDCGKFEAELAKEIRIEKFTLAELEEEEQSLERLRRWHRDLTARDVFGTPEATQATARLKECVAACEDYAERVFRVLHETPADDQ